MSHESNRLSRADYSIEAARHAASRIPGWLSLSEGRLLFRLAREARGSIVEIGSFNGRSTAWLGYGAMSRGEPGVRLYAIDPHLRSSAAGLAANMAAAGLAELVQPMVMRSAEAAEGWSHGEIGLLWIDGSHMKEDVQADIRSFGEFLRPGGIIALHDTVTWRGPRVVVEEMLHGSADFIRVRIRGSITYARKSDGVTADTPFRDAAVFRLRRAKSLAWDVANRIRAWRDPKRRELYARMRSS